MAGHAVFKVKNVEPLSDPGMLMVNEKGIRGGISAISKRFAPANNKYMDEAYDKTKLRKYITHLDESNIYGWTMCQPLPVGNFKWMTNFGN